MADKPKFREDFDNDRDYLDYMTRRAAEDKNALPDGVHIDAFGKEVPAFLPHSNVMFYFLYNITQERFYRGRSTKFSGCKEIRSAKSYKNSTMCASIIERFRLYGDTDEYAVLVYEGKFVSFDLLEWTEHFHVKPNVFPWKEHPGKKKEGG